MYNDWLLEQKELLKEFSEKEWATECANEAIEEAKSISSTENDQFKDVAINSFKWQIDFFQKSNILKLFERLNFSILAGECFSNTFLEDITGILDLLNDFQFPDLLTIHDEDLKLSFEAYLEEVKPFYIYEKCLKEYLFSGKYLLRLVENPTLHTLFDLSNQTNDLIEDLDLKSIESEFSRNHLKLINSNLSLLRKDFTLNYDLTDLKIILNVKHDLSKILEYFLENENTTCVEIGNLIEDKSTFLIRKFITRKCLEDNSHNENYVFLGEEINFDLDSHPFTSSVFSEWDGYSVDHFLSENNSLKSLSLKRTAKQVLEIGKISAWDFHRLTKYFKDLDSDFSKLQLLLNDVNDIPIDNLNFDSYSRNFITNYIANNIFSEKIRFLDKNFDIDSINSIIEKDLNELEKIQSNSHISNFFPYYKICSLLRDFAEFKASNFKKNIENNNDNSIAELRKGIMLLEKYFKQYKKNLQWSKIHLNYAYQLPFGECRKKFQINNEELWVFSSSAFSLPISFDKYDSFLKEIDSFLMRMRNEIDSIEKLTSLINLYSEGKKELEREVKNNTKKNIEQLGIFSAIIALIFGGFSTITTAETSFEQQFIILITLFIILFSFITLLRSFVYKEKSWYSTLGYFLVYLIFLIVIICVLSLVVKITPK